MHALSCSLPAQAAETLLDFWFCQCNGCETQLVLKQWDHDFHFVHHWINYFHNYIFIFWKEPNIILGFFLQLHRFKWNKTLNWVLFSEIELFLVMTLIFSSWNVQWLFCHGDGHGSYAPVRFFGKCSCCVLFFEPLLICNLSFSESDSWSVVLHFYCWSNRFAFHAYWGGCQQVRYVSTINWEMMTMSTHPYQPGLVFSCRFIGLKTGSKFLNEMITTEFNENLMELAHCILQSPPWMMMGITPLWLLTPR